MASSLSSQQFNNSTGGCFQQWSGFGASFNFGDGSNNNENKKNTGIEIMKSTEDFLAAEMTKLSVEERSKALDDLHCVGEDLKETPGMIETLLAEFDLVLHQKRASIFDLAASQNRSYVEDPAFRLRFLRANHHNVNKSVNQMIGFLSRKEKYFGRDTIARDITLEDLDEEDMEVLLSGFLHIQDSRDRSGRVVIFLLNGVLNHCRPTIKSFIRAHYFIFFNILSPMPSVQAKGIVLCYYDFSTPDKPVKLPTLDFMLKFLDYAGKIPVRKSAVHGCLKPIPGSLASKNSVIDNIFKSYQRSTASRSRLHYGSDLELQYTLQSYGVNLESFPVDKTGNLRRNILNVWFNKYIDQRKMPFATSVSSRTVLSPPDRDPQEQVMREGDEPNFFDNTDNSDNSNFAEFYSLQPVAHSLAQPNGAMHCLPTPVDGLIIQQQQSNVGLMGPSLVLDTSSSHSMEQPPVAQHNKIDVPRNNAACGLIIEPTTNDVLMGKGPGIKTHRGNIQFREFVKKYQEEYNNTPRYARVSTPTELTRVLLGMGIRFLKKTENGGYVESDFEEVEKKVKQLFRSQKKSIKKQGD